MTLRSRHFRIFIAKNLRTFRIRPDRIILIAQNDIAGPGNILVFIPYNLLARTGNTAIQRTYNMTPYRRYSRIFIAKNLRIGSVNIDIRIP